MKVLLHGPLHVSFWIYMMELLQEHEFFIDNDANFEEGSVPSDHLNFTPYEKEKDIDVQVVCMHLERKAGTNNALASIEKHFKFPTVWIEYSASRYVPQVLTPLIYTCITYRRVDYPTPLMRHVFGIPSQKLWGSKKWIGDEKKVFIPLRQSLIPHWQVSQKLITKHLKDNGIEVEFSGGIKRDLPFKEWQDKFIHSRVLLEITEKKSSTTLNEGLVIGMPIITFDDNDYKFQIRDGIDGFRCNYAPDILKHCKELIDDYSYAQEMGKKAKARADATLDPQIYRQVWNTAFLDAIEIYNNDKEQKAYAVAPKTPEQIQIEKNRKIHEEDFLKEVLTSAKNSQMEIDALKQKIREDRIMKIDTVSGKMPCNHCGSWTIKRVGDYAFCSSCDHFYGNWIQIWEACHRDIEEIKNGE